MPTTSRGNRLDALAGHLAALASPTRLQLLQQLRTPRALGEIRASPSLTRRGERPDRPLARQSVASHLRQLVAAGLVQRVSEDGSASERYLLNHEQLFAMVDELRALSRLRPVLAAQARDQPTLGSDRDAPPPLPTGPRLLVAYGRDDVAFGLDGPVGASWRIGRAAPCEVRLDYDPYLSTTHCGVRRTDAGYALRDAGSRNGTWVNWRRLPEGEERLLEPGDLLTVGRSVLAFQAPGARLP